MKKIPLYYIINIIVFAAVLLIIGGALFLMPRPGVSQTERRELAAFPDFERGLLLSGGYAEQLGIYFSDTVPYRDSLTDIAARLRDIAGIRAGGVKLYNASFAEQTDESETGDIFIEARTAPACEETAAAERYIPFVPLPEQAADTAAEKKTDDTAQNSGAPESTAGQTQDPPEEPGKPDADIKETPENLDAGGTPAYPENLDGGRTPAYPENLNAGVAASERGMTPEPPDTAEDPGENVEIANNGIMVYGTRALMLYGGSTAMGTRYAAAVNAYKERLGEDVNVYCMIIPTAIEFYCPPAYRRLTGDQLMNINHIYSSLSEDVITVDAYTALSERRDEDIYLRTDHHWAPLGAYYAAEAFCAAADVPATKLDEYETVVIPGYVGTMYGYSGDITIKNNPEDFIYYKPPGEYTTTYYNYRDIETPVVSSLFLRMDTANSYSTFLGGDAKITHIQTDAGNGRRLAVFKESFGNALIPFLVNSFDEIYVIDIRYFPYKAVPYLTDRGITDVLFVNNAFAANTRKFIEYIERFME